MVSNLLNFVNDDVEKMHSLIAGLVGTGVAIEFRSWCKVYKELPDIEDIFSGKMPPAPDSTDAIYALIASMTSSATEHNEDMEKIANSIKYLDKLPPDFSMVLLKNYMCIEKNYKEKLMRIPEFAKWISTRGRLLNGAV